MELQPEEEHLEDPNSVSDEDENEGLFDGDEEDEENLMEDQESDVAS